MKTTATILLFLSFTPFVFGQSDEENLEKYWTYRDRLLKKFMKVDAGQGGSLPFSSFHPKDGPHNFNWVDGVQEAWEGDYMVQIDISDFPDAMFLYSISNTKKVLESGQVVKQR